MKRQNLHSYLKGDHLISEFEKNIKIRGLQINYYFVCKRKLWFFSHHIQMERESELVILGGLLHEESYNNEKKELIIDNLICADFIKKGKTLEVHEVKKSNKMETAHRFQLLYYMHYLKNKKGIQDIKGVIDYPKIKKRTEIILREEDEKELKRVMSEINSIIFGKVPKPVRKSICSKCAYFELCWI
ncbi:CRISPR-associated protein Cas4 [Methanothermobacter wolfeii]|uniref:CRISPR-associated protein Cas4 n=1 Tax=Methanothermobacter wolfeii TaxID=145261 RepID=UPI0024B3BFF4|nr:CRISPR-associated protein Cas4 [Methanothermobacter wolfeii]